MSTDDFWPSNIAEQIPNSPFALMQFQASLLGRKTKNLVVADAVSRSLANEVGEHGIAVDFVLRVPTLGNYRFKLFTVWYGVELYPVHEGEKIVATTEDEFEKYLKRQLQSERTVKIVRSLISQAPEPDDIPF